MPGQSWFKVAVAAAFLCVAAATHASETVTYSYDARGRLVKVEHSGTVNEGVTTQYGFDKADNRTEVTATGAGAVGVADFSFEDPAQGTGWAMNPTAAGATFAGRSGVAANGSAFGFATAPDGSQAGWIQSLNGADGSISLSAAGLRTGASYSVRFHIAQRPGYGANPVTVAFAGASLGSFTPSSSAFTRVATATFTASASTGTLSFTGAAASGDTSSAIDKVEIVRTAIVADPSFEQPNVGTGWTMNPSATGATFAGRSGVAGNGSAFGFASAPDGSQAGFLQSISGYDATISLAVSGLAPGTDYVVRFYSARRSGFGVNPVTVAFDGNGLGTFTPASTSFAQSTSAAFTASAATGTLTFTVPQSGPDLDSAIDLVTIEAAP